MSICKNSKFTPFCFETKFTAQEKRQARLADPRTIESLNLLLDKLDVMAFSVSALDGFLRRGDQVVESLSDGVQDLKKMTNQDSNVVLPKTLGKS